MRKIRWQLVIIFLTGLVVGILLLSDQKFEYLVGQHMRENVPPRAGDVLHVHIQAGKVHAVADVHGLQVEIEARLR